MSEKFEQIIEKNYRGLNFLSISHGDYLPGVIIDNEDRIVDAIWNVFPDWNKEKWKVKEVDLRIAGGATEADRKLDITGKILGVFSLKAGVTADYSISFEFDKCSSIIFDTSNGGGLYENQVIRSIRELKETDREIWRDLIRNFFVMESVFVESFRTTFKRNGKVLVGADLEMIEQEVKIAAKYNWGGNGTMEISDNKNPFGVRGFIIKRHM